MSDDEEDTVCPLCVEELDLSDRNFLPCPCGYKVCMWCWHHIKENLNGLCPACRTPYNADPHHFAQVDKSEVKKDKLKKDKQKSDEKVVKNVVKSNQTSSGAGSSNNNSNNSNNNSNSGSNNNVNLDRKHLHNYRVVQRNLVYVIGMPSNTASEDTVRSANYFGQYGKITKTVIHKNNNISLSTVSAYCTFWNREDAKAAIQALDGFWLEGHQLRASFGTTKYCNSFVRGVSCSNPDCVYLHDYGEDEDRYTKEDIVNPTIAVTSVNPANSSNKSIANTLITGMGGPSGTGRRPVGEPTLPPPVFTQESAIAAGNQAVIQQVAAAAAAEKAERAAASAGTVAKGSKAASWAGMAAGVTADSAALPDVSGTNSQQSDHLPPLHPQKSQGGGQSVASIGGSGAPTTAGASKASKKEQHASAGAVAPASVATETAGSSSPKVAPSAPPRAATPTAAPAPTPLLAITPSFQYNAYNGFGKCAVFPVPTSTYHLSIWHKIMHASSSDLSVNPFSMYTSMPAADLLELTLPPVDSIGNLPMWPRPLSYYYSSNANRSAGAKPQGQSSGGQSPNPIANLTPQQLALLQQQMLQSQNGMGAQGQQQGLTQGGNMQQSGSNGGQMAMLQQIFPGVKMGHNGHSMR